VKGESAVPGALADEEGERFINKIYNAVGVLKNRE